LIPFLIGETVPGKNIKKKSTSASSKKNQKSPLGNTKKVEKDIWGILKLDKIEDFSEIVLDVYAYRRGCDTTHSCVTCKSC
jgi:hypothetical protein